MSHVVVQMTDTKKLLLATEDDIWAIKRYNDKQDEKAKLEYKIGQEHSTSPKTYDLFVDQSSFEMAQYIVRHTIPVTTDLSLDAEFYKWLFDPES